MKQLLHDCLLTVTKRWDGSPGLVSRNNGQHRGLAPVQRTHMGMQLLHIHLFIVSHLFLSSLVKYMREATPYVKKGSPVSEIGWETPPPESPRLGCASAEPMSQLSLSIHRDRKTIPLKMCYVTRNMTVSDPENRWMGFAWHWDFTSTLNGCWCFLHWGWWAHTASQQGKGALLWEEWVVMSEPHECGSALGYARETSMQ